MIKQFDNLLHPKYGEGYVLSITHRRKSDLYFITYLSGGYDWMLEEELKKYLKDSPEEDETIAGE
jgi:hypothetical protein